MIIAVIVMIIVVMAIDVVGLIVAAAAVGSGADVCNSDGCGCCCCRLMDRFRIHSDERVRNVWLKVGEILFCENKMYYCATKSSFWKSC